MGPGDTFTAFFRLGVAHILLGFDHLLFLAGLLLVARSWRSIVIVITSFTVAHSCTLALATFSLVSLPSRWAEPLIAASILWVGVENIVERGEPKQRWIVTFFFGLVHGFGFASVLRDLGLGHNGRGIALPLFSFNLGVEVGQIAVAAVLVPLLWKLAESPRYRTRWLPLLSGIVALGGAYWLVLRLVASGKS
jgi:hydrogenase/urease accessory protein HupE